MFAPVSFSIGYTLPNGSTDTYKLNYQHDNLKRLDEAIYGFGTDTTPIYTRSYDYLDYVGDSSRTTSRLGTYTVKDGGDNLLLGNQYEYDANGNITKVKEAYLSGNTIAYRIAAEYEYDALNQLKTETRYDYSTTPVSTTTVSYTVDTAGNLRTVSGGGHIVSYTYGNSAWADLLTAVTVDGISYSISYASPGNPSNWFNENLYENLTWTQGRRLSSLTVGNSTYSYEYDMSGIRSAKVANGLRHEYVTQNGRVVRETVYALDNTTGEYTVFQYALDFTYDEAGHPLTMRRYNNANMQADYVTMQYVCNAQGDVVKLIYEGAVYAEYSYDAWGNAIIKSGSLDYENVNPLRYRGYYYDTETGFYYLQSRYYDPIVKRFINADSYASTGQGFLGYNSFGYCNNSPVNRIDIDGTFSFWWILFVDHRFGFIHLCVQKHIVSTYPNTYMESWVSKNNSHVGRVDIYKHNGAAWEVKSKNTAYLALEQLENYMGGVVDGGAHTIQYPGPAGEFSGSFAIIYGKMIFVVIYRTPSPGVISYDIDELSEGETCPEDHYEYIRNITSPVQTPKPATVDTPVFIPLPGGGGGQPQYSYNGSGGGWSFGFARFCSAVC